MNLSKFAFLLLFLSLALSACAGAERHERIIWYVAVTGNDSNSCTEPDQACLTLFAAFRRADADDEIIVGPGTFIETNPRRSEDSYVFEHINYDIWITGAGRDATTIDFGNTYAGFYVDDGGHLRLENLTVQNARGNSPGGCLFVTGASSVDMVNVNLHRCLYSGIVNFSVESIVNLTDVNITETIIREPYAAGSGIYNVGTLTIEGGEFSSNGTYGIGSSGTLEINNALINGNPFGGLSINGGNATLTNITIQNNAGENGHVDGIEVSGNAIVSILDSTILENPRGLSLNSEDARVIVQGGSITHNTQQGILVRPGELYLDGVDLSENGGDFPSTGIASGIVNSGGTIEIRNSQVSRNLNGAIDNEAGQLTIGESAIMENVGGVPAVMNVGTMNIQNSLIANNLSGEPRVVSSDAAVENRGEMTIANSTISGNQGSGIQPLAGHLSLSFVTIANNTELGINMFHGGETIRRIANSVIANNGGRGNCTRNSAPSTPAISLVGTNIETTTPRSFLFGESCGFPVAIASEDLHLDGLADNGGPTMTHALLPGSPALDAATGICVEIDQRFTSRPFGPACDVGAYEASGITTSLEGFPTPTVDIPLITIDRDYPCYTGPGPQYNTLSTLKAGDQLQLVGYGFGGGWFVALHPQFEGLHCWINEDFATPSIPIDQMRLIAIPAKPTPTPSSTPEPRQGSNLTPTACVTVPPNNYTVCK